MNKKFFPVLLVLTIACFIIAFSKGSNNDNPRSKYEKVLRESWRFIRRRPLKP